MGEQTRYHHGHWTCAPQNSVTLCCPSPPQEPSWSSPDIDTHPNRGFLGLPRPQGISFSVCMCCMGHSCSPKGSNIRSHHVHVKDYVFATKGRIQCLSTGVRAGWADYGTALCQPMICPVLYHLCHSAVCWRREGITPSLFLYPFCVENLYLLWECNLFLMDNVTLSGAGSWVSWSDIFR